MDQSETTMLPRSFNPAYLLLTVIERLLDSRVDMVGDRMEPKSLVETYWLNELELAWRKLDMAERRKIVAVLEVHCA